MQCRNVTTLWNLLWDDDGMDGIGGTGIVGPLLSIVDWSPPEI